MKQSGLIQKIILFGVYLVLFLTPIIFLPVVFRPFDMGKSVPFKVSMALLTITFCLWQIFKPTAEMWSKKFRILFPFALPTFLLILSNLFSTFMSDDIWMSVVGLYERQIGTSGFLLCVLFAFYIVLLSTKEHGYTLGLKVIKTMTFLLAAASVLQYFKIYDFMFRDPGGRSNALLGNANFLADQIVFFAPLFLSAYFLVRDSMSKMLNLFYFAVCVLGILVTGTRGAYVAIGASVLSFLFLLLVVNDSPDKRKVNTVFLRLLFGILIFVVTSFIVAQLGNFYFILGALPVILFLVWSYFRLALKTTGKPWRQATPWLLALVLVSSLIAGGGATLRSENPIVGRYFSIFELSNKSGSRYSLWQDSISFAQDIPLWGVGPEMFREKFMPYKSKATEQIEPHILYDNPHNNYFYILFSLGPVGLLLHLWIVGRFFRMSYSLVADQKCDRAIRITAAGFFTTMVSYTVWTIPGFEFLSSIASFWALIGIFCIFYASVREREEFWELKILGRFKNAVNILKNSVVSTPGYLVIIVLSAWLIIDNLSIFSADVHFVHGLINRNRKQFSSSIADFEKALTYNPRESSYYLNIGKSYFDLIQLEADFETKKRYSALADAALEKGLRHAWSPDLIYSTKASVRLAMGDKQGAIEAMNRVLEVYPATIEYRKFLNYIINDFGK